MEFSLIIFRQTILMSLYMLIGYALFRGKKIDAQGSRAIASVLVWAVIPSTIVKSCLIAYTPQRLYQMGESFLLGAATLVIAMAVARICFGKDQVGQFAASFSNAGFIGIPLVQASLGDDAVFYIIGLIILLNLLQWTYGASLLKGEKMQFSFKSILLTPITIAAIIGVAIFASGMGDALPALCTNLISGDSVVYYDCAGCGCNPLGIVLVVIFIKCVCINYSNTVFLCHLGGAVPTLKRIVNAVNQDKFIGSFRHLEICCRIK